MTSRLTSGQAGALTRSVAFPKVNLATQVSLKPVLTRLGMGVAFSPAADFTALSPQACCIGFVAHAATLDIGEKGTVASADTLITLLHRLYFAIMFYRCQYPERVVVYASGTGSRGPRVGR